MEDYFDWDYIPYSAEGCFFLYFKKSGCIAAVHNTDRDIMSYEHPDYYWSLQDWINSDLEEGSAWPIPMTQKEIVEVSLSLNLFIHIPK